MKDIKYPSLSLPPEPLMVKVVEETFALPTANNFACKYVLSSSMAIAWRYAEETDPEDADRFVPHRGFIFRATTATMNE